MAFILSVVFSTGSVPEGYVSDYQFCLDNGNSKADCESFVNSASQVAGIIDSAYLGDFSVSDYVACVKEEKAKYELDYSVIQSVCFDSVMQKNTLEKKASLFKVNCFSDLDANSKMLDVKCKTISPSTNYSLNVSLETDANKLLVKPVLQYKSGLGSGTKINESGFVFDLNKTELPLGFKYIEDEIKLELVSLVNADSNQSIVNILDPSFYSVQKIKPNQMYSSFLDCMTIKILFSKEQSAGKYVLKKSGIIFDTDENKMVTACKDDVTYAFAKDLDSYDSDKKMFSDILQQLLANYLNDSKFDAKADSVLLSQILSAYKTQEALEKTIAGKKGSAKLGLDEDYFLSFLDSVLSSVKGLEKEKVLEGAGNTLLKNREDLAKLRKKDSVLGMLKFFEEDVSKGGESLQKIFEDIEFNLLKNIFEKSDSVDLTDVTAEISPNSIKVKQFVFDFVKPLVVWKDSQIIPAGGKTVLVLPDYNINTGLTLTLLNNTIYVGAQAVKFLDYTKIKKFYDSEAVITDVELVKDDETLAFVVKKEVLGKLFGFISTKEIIVEKYYSETSILYGSEKPWWDFLIVYNL